MDTLPLEAQGFDRDRLLHAFRRWAALVAAAAILAGVAGFIVSKLTPAEYEATAQLYLAPASDPVAFQDVALGQSLATSYVQLATAEVVLTPVMQQVGWTGSLNSFRDRLTVAQVRNTSIITMTFRSPDAKLAAQTANAIADTFTKLSRQLQESLQGSTTTELEQQIRAVQEDIGTLDTEIAALRAELASSKPGVSQAELQTRLSLLDNSRQTKQQTLAQLLKTRDEIRLARARAETAVSLWQPATPQETPVSPRPLLNTILGGFSGALVALIIVALVAYLDDRLTDLEDVRRRLGAAPLGQIRLHPQPDTIEGKLFVRDDPTSPESEAIRGIRTNLLFAGVDRTPRTLLITSATPGEGKSVLSANLALAFAEAGTPVVLVDADLRRPSQHRFFRVSASTGLTTLLTDSSPPTHLENFLASPQLVVIPSGPLPPNPAELLGSARMSALLEQLSALAPGGIVIVDSSPVLAVTDPIALATKVDGCVMVIDSSHTRVGSTRRALAALARVHARVIGVVLNKLAETEASYYSYDGYSADQRSEPGPLTEVRRA